MPGVPLAPNLDPSPSDFSNELGQKIAREIGTSDSSNLLISPLSLTIALGGLYAGSRGGTERELASIFGLGAGSQAKNLDAFASLTSVNPDQSKALSVANSIWTAPRFHLLHSYKDLVSKKFSMEAQTLPNLGAQGVSRINRWVDVKTHGVIQTLLDHLKPEDKVILLNALYFNGKWRFGFPEQSTKLRDFHSGRASSPLTTHPVPTMDQTRFFDYTAEGSIQILRLPYQEGFSMWIALPPEGGDLTSALAALEQSHSMATRRVHVLLPKFSFGATYQLKGDLSNLGMKGLFQRANLDGMSAEFGRQGAVVSEVLQKTKIEVDEVGTIAAAVTGIRVRRAIAMRPTPPVEFNADHPFTFAIRNDLTGADLFLGEIWKLP
jgi:serine protease inhibitor